MVVRMGTKLKKFKMEVDAYGKVIKSNDPTFIERQNKRIAQQRKTAEEGRRNNEEKAS